MSRSNRQVSTNEDTAALHFCSFMSKKYPSSFREVAINNNFSPVIRRMTVIETATLAKDIGIPDCPLFDKLGRHLRVINNGSPVLCPITDFNDMSKDAPKVTIDKGYIVKKGKKERYTMATVDVLEQMTMQMSREIECSYILKPKTYHNLKKSLFGY